MHISFARDAHSLRAHSYACKSASTCTKKLKSTCGLKITLRPSLRRFQMIASSRGYKLTTEAFTFMSPFYADQNCISLQVKVSNYASGTARAILVFGFFLFIYLYFSAALNLLVTVNTDPFWYLFFVARPMIQGRCNSWVFFGKIIRSYNKTSLNCILFFSIRIASTNVIDLSQL